MRFESIVQQSQVDQLVHGAIMVVLLVLASGMAFYSLQRGIRKPAILTACLSYGLATAFTFIAGTFDGFVVPALVRRCAPGLADCMQSTEPLLRFVWACVGTFTRIGLLLMVGSIVLWSIDLLLAAVTRLRGIAGLALSLLQLWLLFGFAYVLTPTSLLAVMAAQVAWYLIAAVTITDKRLVQF